MGRKNTMNEAIFRCVNLSSQEQIYGVCDIKQYTDRSLRATHPLFRSGKDEEQDAAGEKQQSVNQRFLQNGER